MNEEEVGADDISTLTRVFRGPRYVVGGLLLVLTALSYRGPIADRLEGVIPALSPFTGLVATVGRRALPTLLILALPVLLLTVLRRRWFCAYACPTGLILQIAGGIRQLIGVRNTRVRFPRIGRWLVFLALGGAALGCPVLIWLDPLSILSGALSPLRGPVSLLSVIPAAGLLLLVAISVWQPNLWCARICPLGASQELLRDIASLRPRRERHPKRITGRRTFLGLAGGALSGSLLRYLPSRPRVIRPPGAAQEGRFGALCARCGTCVASCPERIIRHDFGGSGIANLMTPALTIGESYCSELCNACGKRCPTGAIASRPLSEKQNIAIGVAEVLKPLCLSWEKHEFCMKCGDFCPYGAVRSVDDSGVRCPEIIADKCRGCGACQVVCPTHDPAIVVTPAAQRDLESVHVHAVKDLIEML